MAEKPGENIKHPSTDTANDDFFQSARTMFAQGESALKEIGKLLPAGRLTDAQAADYANREPETYASLLRERDRAVKKIGELRDALALHQKKDPRGQNISAYRDLYTRLAQAEAAIPFLKIAPRDEKIIAAMPIPRLELERLAQREDIEKKLGALLSDSGLRDSLPDFLSSKLQEIIRGFAYGLSDDIENIKAFFTLLAEDPMQIVRAFKEVFLLLIKKDGVDLLGALHAAAVDSMADWIAATVESEGESLAYDMGYAISKSSAFMMFGLARAGLRGGAAAAEVVSGVALDAGHAAYNTSKVLRMPLGTSKAVVTGTAENLPHTGNLEQKLRTHEVYSKIVSSLAEKYPAMSVFAARNFFAGLVDRFGKLPQSQTARMTNDLLATIGNPEQGFTAKIQTNTELIQNIKIVLNEMAPGERDNIIDTILGPAGRLFAAL